MHKKATLTTTEYIPSSTCPQVIVGIAIEHAQHIPSSTCPQVIVGRKKMDSAIEHISALAGSHHLTIPMARLCNGTMVSVMYLDWVEVVLWIVVV